MIPCRCKCCRHNHVIGKQSRNSWNWRIEIEHVCSKKSLKITKGGNQNPYIEEELTTQWPKEIVQKDKQRSTKHTHKTKDRVTRTPLKTELRFSGRVSSKSWNFSFLFFSFSLCFSVMSVPYFLVISPHPHRHTISAHMRLALSTTTHTLFGPLQIFVIETLRIKYSEWKEEIKLLNHPAAEWTIIVYFFISFS